MGSISMTSTTASMILTNMLPNTTLRNILPSMIQTNTPASTIQRSTLTKSMLTIALGITKVPILFLYSINTPANQINSNPIPTLKWTDSSPSIRVPSISHQPTTKLRSTPKVVVMIRWIEY